MNAQSLTRNASQWLDPCFAQWARTPRRALLLDYDGTLAPFRVERNEAAPYPGVRERLQRILDADHTRLVFITGRRVKNLMPLLELKPVPEIWGAHGWERRRVDGRIEVQPMEPPDEAALARLAGRLAQLGHQARAERKPGSLTLHLRGLSLEDAAQLRDQVLAEAPDLIAGSALQIRDFHGGVEFYLAGQHKGSAVATVLGEMGPDCAAVFLGDDATDEDAFRVIKERGGIGILVAREPRASLARHCLRPPEELLEFLDRWANLRGAA